MNPRDRRALVIGGVVVLAATVLLRGVPWAAGRVATLRARAHESVAAAERARELLAQVPAFHDSLARALPAVVALAPKLVETGTAAEAGAALAGQVNAIAGHTAVRVLRIDPLPDSSAGVFGRVAVRAELEGDVRGLARFLAAVERGLPVLGIASFGVHAGAAAAPSVTMETLRVEVTITGLFLRRGAR